MSSAIPMVKQYTCDIKVSGKLYLCLLLYLIKEIKLENQVTIWWNQCSTKSLM